MNFFKKTLLSTSVVLSVQSFFYQGSLSAMDVVEEITIPSTLSAESQGSLQYFNSVLKTTGNKLFNIRPNTQELGEWDALFEEKEKLYTSFNDAIVAKFQPNIEKRSIGNVPVLDVKPKNWKENGKVIVYVHGGGFTTASAESQKIGAVPLADMTGTRVITIDYTRAPHAKSNVILDQVVSVFKGLKDEKYTMDDIAAYGDSAGANLVAASTLKMRDEEIGMPVVVALWSPWIDLTGSGDTYKTLERQDPCLSAEALRKCALAYAPQDEHTNPLVSPLFGDFTKGFSPTLIQCGTKDMLLSDAIRLHRKLKSAGQKVKLDIQEGMWHVSQAFDSGLPESIDALKTTASFMKRHLFKDRREEEVY